MHKTKCTMVYFQDFTVLERCLNYTEALSCTWPWDIIME